MATDIGDKKQKRVTNSKNRRSRKKRRTEISSSEEDSSSSDSSDHSTSDSDGETLQQKQSKESKIISDNDVEMKENTGDAEDVKIDNLRMNINQKPEGIDTKTESDVTATRLKLRQIDDMDISTNVDNKSSNLGVNDSTGISSDAWLKLMLTEYEDDIDALRKTAADFKGESIQLVAEMLRATKEIFKEV